MISRRIIRIKVMQLLYAYFINADAPVDKIEKELFFSINKTYDLFHYLLLLIVSISDYANQRIEIAKRKKIPTPEDIKPNTKFIDNKLICQLQKNKTFDTFINNRKLSWNIYPNLIKNLYQKLTESEDYKKYMKNTERSFEEDKSLVCNFYINILSVYEPLCFNLEEQSIYWNDELEFVISIIIKTLEKFQPSTDDNFHLPVLYKSKEDIDFTKRLFRKVILNEKEYLSLIEKFSKNWDVERIAFMDVLIMQMAIAEAIEFESIPTKVTFNEYLEIAKYYSTSKSNIFINGSLDRIFEYLKQNKKINKKGRGLIGEVC